MARPEDSRVKIPALVHFTRLGYQYMSIKDMVRGVDYDPDTNIFYGLFLDETRIPVRCRRSGVPPWEEVP